MTSSRSYSEALRSTAIIGGAQAINMAIGLVKTKLVAVLIGPSGVGLLGIYQSIIALTSTMAGMGISASGVRDVAKYHGKDDQLGVVKTITTLRRVSWLTGFTGMLLLCAMAPWISKISFGSLDFTWPIIALSITILLGNIAGGQGAIIQGTRRIGDIARINILGALVGTVVAVGFYTWFGIDGIVPSLILVSLISLVISTYFLRRIEFANVATPWRDSWRQSRSLIRFGLSMTISGVVAVIVAYFIRVLITREYGLAGVGIFSAAFNLSGLFVQFVLNAMGTDFYPRLTTASDDHNRMVQLMNEQTEIGLSLAFPGLLATFVFAPFAMTLFYTAEFAPATSMLQWFIVGCMGRVLSWPLGFSLLAKGQGGLFMASEVTFHLIHLGLVWIGLNTVGLDGAALAFAALNVIYIVSMLLITKQTIGFSWSKNVWGLLAWMGPIGLVVFFISRNFPQAVAIPLGVAIGIASGIICLRHLVLQLGMQHRVTRTIHSLPGGKILLRGLQIS